MELTVFKGASSFLFICDISKFKFYFSVILWLKFDQAPLVNAFCCVFKKEFFKHFQKKVYLSIFLSPNITEKNLKIVYFQVSGTYSVVFFRKLNFALFITISKFKFYFFINFVDEVCPHPPHE